jgi:hypothetical protein
LIAKEAALGVGWVENSDFPGVDFEKDLPHQ